MYGDWPNGWKGGRVHGRDEVRAYWERQWAQLDPHVEPVAISERDDGRLEVRVGQVGRDLAGTVLFDEEVRHVYAYRGHLVAGMTIERDQP